MPPGFNPTGVMTAKASLDHVPLLESATFRSCRCQSGCHAEDSRRGGTPLSDCPWPYERALLSGVILSDGKEAGPEVTTNEVSVTRDISNTLQIPVLAGRAFADSDTPDAQPVSYHQPGIPAPNKFLLRDEFRGAPCCCRFSTKPTRIS